MNHDADPSSDPPPPYSDSSAEREGGVRAPSGNEDLDKEAEVGVCTCGPKGCGCGCAKVTMEKNITVLHGM